MVYNSHRPVFSRRFDTDIHTLIHRGPDRRVSFGDRLAALDRIAGIILVAAAMILLVWLVSIAAGTGLLRISSATADSAAPALDYPQTTAAPTGHLKWSEIRDLQVRLANLGFNPGRIDGIAGRRTLGALNRYRAAQHLDRASFVDRVTVADLLD